MKERLVKLGLSEEAAEEAVRIIKKEYVTSEKYNKDTSILNDRIAALSGESKELKEKHKKDIESIKIENAIETELVRARAKTGNAVKALIDREKIGFDDKGNVTGVKEQMKALCESEETGYLFEKEKKEEFKGVSIGQSERECEADLSKMNYSEMCAYFEQAGIK
ncbi:MAG: phage scaffolding protein [Clostridia bacterium]|nr:phage scaffolding protein [Clostridia bacterium]